MRIRMLLGITIAGFVVLAVACQDAAGPAPPDLALQAKGGNGGGNGGGSNNPGPGNKKGDLYADLVFLFRDADGLPLLKSYDVEGEAVLCVQPVSYLPLPILETEVPVQIEKTVNPVNGLDVWLIPLYGDYMPPAPTDADVAAPDGDDSEEVALAPCDPYGELNDAGELILTYGGYAEEVPFGRLNIGRAPERTVDRAYAEVDLKLAAAQTILLDHAGRWSPDDVPIDAPAENLVIHRELLTRGQFGDYVVPGPGPWYDFLHHAASTLAGASDKFGVLSEDLIVYNDRILGFPDAAQSGGLPTITGDGVHGFPGEKYLDFGGFTYTRSETFPGCVVAGTWDDDGNPIQIQGTILDLVFEGVDAANLENINAFATRADDARQVVLYEHDFWIFVIDRIGETAVCDEYGIQ